MAQPFDPLDYDNIAKSVVDALLERPPEGLHDIEPFAGAGIYAIYYAGSFEPYQPIAGLTPEVPIYVGQAIPAGARKGADAGRAAQGRVLYGRLVQHARSIGAAENLRVADFLCRYLPVESVWISLAEHVLIDKFRPLWNTVIDGFGNHPPGKGRGAMRRPRWDIVHPGRAWAAKLAPQEDLDDILRDVRGHLARRSTAN